MREGLITSANLPLRILLCSAANSFSSKHDLFAGLSFGGSENLFSDVWEGFAVCFVGFAVIFATTGFSTTTTLSSD